MYDLNSPNMVWCLYRDYYPAQRSGGVKQLVLSGVWRLQKKIEIVRIRAYNDF